MQDEHLDGKRKILERPNSLCRFDNPVPLVGAGAADVHRARETTGQLGCHGTSSAR